MEELAAKTPGRRTLLAALFALLAVVWLEPPGSRLAEPDETRYAEIPREMLAAGDLVVPRLNGVPYFEKPPLLYWANAASLRIFGETPWAARLPTRLAGLGTLALVFLAARGAGLGGAAAVFLLAAPMGFLFSRTNLTDGLLTFFLTAALLAGRAAVLRREIRAALAGHGRDLRRLRGGSVSHEGSHRDRPARADLPRVGRGDGAARDDAPDARAFARTARLPRPRAALASRRRAAPRRLSRLLHRARASSGGSPRGPPGARVPSTTSCPSSSSGSCRASRSSSADSGGRCARATEGFFFFVWFTIVFVFFSASGSKLPPYLFPAIPAAAVLAALGMPKAGGRAAWIVQAVLATILAVALISHPELRTAAKALHLEAVVAPALALLVLASWLAVLLAARSRELALASVAAGWVCFFAAVAIGWPKTPQARLTHELAEAARATASPWKAPIVGYRDYLNGLSWELRTPIPVADYKGELEPEFETDPAVRDRAHLGPRALLGRVAERTPRRRPRPPRRSRGADDRQTTRPRRPLLRPPRDRG